MSGENKSYAGDVPRSKARTDAINKRLAKMVDEMTHPYTCAEIAEFCLLSKQAVYQIEKKAFRKIANKYPELKEELYG